MNRLLCAGYIRLFKNKLFWAAVVVTAAMGIMGGHTKYVESLDGYAADLSDALFSGVYMAAIAVAVISPMFSGTEYSDGTIRNKIIAGHKRIHIYLSNLILSYTAGILSMLGFMVPYSAICLVTLGKTVFPVSTLFLYVCLACLALLAVCAIFNAVTMLLAKKAAAAVACLLLIAVGFMSALSIDYRIKAPKMIGSYVTDDTGGMVYKEEPNPHYLTGIWRQVYETVYNLTPTGQIVQILALEVKMPGLIAVYSAGIILIFTGVGIGVFRKMDIK